MNDVNRLCKQCSAPLVGGRKDRKFCDRACAAEHTRLAWRSRNPKSALATLTNNTIAEVNEMRVAIDLLKRGYEVYRATFQGMPCDILANLKHKNGYDSYARFEVTTGNRTSSGTVVHPARDATKFDVLAVVVGDEIFYKPSLD